MFQVLERFLKMGKGVTTMQKKKGKKALKKINKIPLVFLSLFSAKKKSSF